MAKENTTIKTLIFHIITITIPCVTIYSIISIFKDTIYARLEPLVVEYVSVNLDPKEKEEIKKAISKNYAAIYESVPESKVGRIAKKYINATMRRANVKTNNAGMRHTKSYGPKAKGIYRIICLGDSFVFGSGGKQEDRFCDQLERWFSDNGVLIENKKVETYAVGQESWTMLQEATYMASRISNYDPDLILVLTVGNDITDPTSVTQDGLLTTRFTDLHRERGSAVFSDLEPLKFNISGDSVLKNIFTAESNIYWDEAVRSMKRLWELQNIRGKKILFSVLMSGKINPIYGFGANFRKKLLQHGILAPFMPIAYQPTMKTQLPHDNHPNRFGHQLIRDQYLNALYELKWIDVDADIVPSLEKTYAVNLGAPPPESSLEDLAGYLIHQLTTAIDFKKMKQSDLHNFLGGILPFREGKNALNSAPWSSVRSGFVLRREPQHKKMIVDIEIPPLPELYPMVISLFVDGKRIRDYNYRTNQEHGNKRFIHVLEENIEKSKPIEIIFEVDRYFTEISDHRMRSFRYLKAELR